MKAFRIRRSGGGIVLALGVLGLAAIPVRAEGTGHPQISVTAGPTARMTDRDLSRLMAQVQGVQKDIVREVQDEIARAMKEEPDAAPFLERLSMTFTGPSSQLQKRVDVDLRDSTVRQAAEALSKSAGITVRVDDSVPKEQRVTLEARRVPLASVLEALGRQLNLMIAPEGNGVALQAWPSLKVNNTGEPMTGKNAPWSDEWIIPPTAFSSDMFMFRGSRPGPDFPNPAVIPSAAMAYTAPALTRSGTFSVASVGDRLVVAEPGTGPDRARGVWLTVYMLRGNELTQVSRMFHRAVETPGPAQPGPKPTAPR